MSEDPEDTPSELSMEELVQSTFSFIFRHEGTVLMSEFEEQNHIYVSEIALCGLSELVIRNKVYLSNTLTAV